MNTNISTTLDLMSIDTEKDSEFLDKHFSLDCYAQKDQEEAYYHTLNANSSYFDA